MSDDPTVDATSPERRDVCGLRSNPNRAWVCGYADFGKCCASGPTAKGRCGLTVATANNRSSAGGEEDLTPCIPRRSHRWSRQSLCTSLAILTGGCLLLCMTLPSREKIFVPGELSGKHAQILDNTLVSQRCSLCHPNSHNVRDGISKVFAVDDGAQDRLCMQCHHGHMPAAMDRNPHDLSAEVLSSLASQGPAPVWRSVSNHPAQVSPQESAKTNCADCHIEHHGRKSDLKAMADDRCQACHRRKFESLASGHPEFENFPAKRERAFAFSHALHAQKHFPQKNRDFDCRKCHVDEDRSSSLGPVTRSVSFETSCAECHQEPIRAATVDGWAVLQLPSIDATTASGTDFEHWPTEARFGFEGTISPVLRALLEADDEAQAALGLLPSSGQLIEVSTLDGRREQVTKALALAIKRLIDETARNGQAAWRERLAKVTRSRTGHELSAGETALLEAMCAGLPPDLFRQMQSTWFNRTTLARDHERAGDALQFSAAPPAAPQRAALAPRRSGQAAAPAAPSSPLHRPLARSQGIIVERKPSGLLISDTLTTSDDLLRNDEGDIEHENDSLLSEAIRDGESLDDRSLDDGLLEGQSLDDELLQSTSQKQGKARLDSRLADDSDLLESEPLHSDSQVIAENASLRGPNHLAGGGWYIDRDTVALRYMPTGHGDKTLAAWSMWWTLFPREAEGATASQVLGANAASATPSVAQQVPGGCSQCHQLRDHAQDRSSIGLSWSAAWQAPERSAAIKEFTKFNHGPHLSLPAVSDCRYCHILADQSNAPLAGPAAKFASLTSVVQTQHDRHMGSDFCGMQLAQCVACHRPNGANAGCVQCHNYHIAQPAMASSSSAK